MLRQTKQLASAACSNTEDLMIPSTELIEGVFYAGGKDWAVTARLTGYVRQDRAGVGVHGFGDRPIFIHPYFVR